MSSLDKIFTSENQRWWFDNIDIIIVNLIYKDDLKKKKNK